MMAIISAQPIMLNFLPIILLSSAQKCNPCALYYAHNYSNYAFIHNLIISNDHIYIVILGSSLLHFFPIMLSCRPAVLILKLQAKS